MRSNQRAVAAHEAGRFADELVPVTVAGKRGKPDTVVDRDEHPRADATVESLGALRPIRLKVDPESTVTAGNASGQNDGAAMCVVTTRAEAEKRGLTPLLALRSWAVTGCGPEVMGIGPVSATAAALDRAGLTLDDIDLIELNEAFAAQVLAVLRDREWADLVRKASSHRGPWPRVSVWHGNDDKTVIPSNALEILKQWTEIHGLPLFPSVKTRVDGYPREVWIDEAGDELIEAYTITNMAHGTPLAIGEAEGACGAPGPFLLPVGISSSYHIAKFFGIAVARASVERNMVTLSPAPHQIKGAEPVLEGEILDKDDEPIRQQEPTPPLPDIGAIINNALRAAGLIKD